MKFHIFLYILRFYDVINFSREFPRVSAFAKKLRAALTSQLCFYSNLPLQHKTRLMSQRKAKESCAFLCVIFDSPPVNKTIETKKETRARGLTVGATARRSRAGPAEDARSAVLSSWKRHGNPQSACHVQLLQLRAWTSVSTHAHVSNQLRSASINSQHLNHDRCPAETRRPTERLTGTRRDALVQETRAGARSVSACVHAG